MATLIPESNLNTSRNDSTLNTDLSKDLLCTSVRTHKKGARDHATDLNDVPVPVLLCGSGDTDESHCQITIKNPEPSTTTSGPERDDCTRGQKIASAMVSMFPESTKYWRLYRLVGYFMLDLDQYGINACGLTSSRSKSRSNPNTVDTAKQSVKKFDELVSQCSNLYQSYSTTTTQLREKKQKAQHLSTSLAEKKNILIDRLKRTVIETERDLADIKFKMQELELAILQSSTIIPPSECIPALPHQFSIKPFVGAHVASNVVCRNTKDTREILYPHNIMAQTNILVPQQRNMLEKILNDRSELIQAISHIDDNITQLVDGMNRTNAHCQQKLASYQADLKYRTTIYEKTMDGFLNTFRYKYTRCVERLNQLMPSITTLVAATTKVYEPLKTNLSCIAKFAPVIIPLTVHLFLNRGVAVGDDLIYECPIDLSAYFKDWTMNTEDGASSLRAEPQSFLSNTTESNCSGGTPSEQAIAYQRSILMELETQLKAPTSTSGLATKSLNEYIYQILRSATLKADYAFLIPGLEKCRDFFRLMILLQDLTPSSTSLPADPSNDDTTTTPTTSGNLSPLCDSITTYESPTEDHFDQFSVNVEAVIEAIKTEVQPNGGHLGDILTNGLSVPNHSSAATNERPLKRPFDTSFPGGEINQLSPGAKKLKHTPRTLLPARTPQTIPSGDSGVNNTCPGGNSVGVNIPMVLEPCDNLRPPQTPQPPLRSSLSPQVPAPSSQSTPIYSPSSNGIVESGHSRTVPDRPISMVQLKRHYFKCLAVLIERLSALRDNYLGGPLAFDPMNPDTWKGIIDTKATYGFVVLKQKEWLLTGDELETNAFGVQTCFQQTPRANTMEQQQQTIIPALNGVLQPAIDLLNSTTLPQCTAPLLAHQNQPTVSSKSSPLLNTPSDTQYTQNINGTPKPIGEEEKEEEEGGLANHSGMRDDNDIFSEGGGSVNGMRHAATHIRDALADLTRYRAFAESQMPNRGIYTKGNTRPHPVDATLEPYDGVTGISLTNSIEFMVAAIIEDMRTTHDLQTLTRLNYSKAYTSNNNSTPSQTYTGFSHHILGGNTINVNDSADYGDDSADTVVPEDVVQICDNLCDTILHEVTLTSKLSPHGKSNQPAPSNNNSEKASGEFLSENCSYILNVVQQEVSRAVDHMSAEEFREYTATMQTIASSLTDEELNEYAALVYARREALLERNLSLQTRWTEYQRQMQETGQNTTDDSIIAEFTPTMMNSAMAPREYLYNSANITATTAQKQCQRDLLYLREFEPSDINVLYGASDHSAWRRFLLDHVDKPPTPPVTATALSALTRQSVVGGGRQPSLRASSTVSARAQAKQSSPSFRKTGLETAPVKKRSDAGASMTRQGSPDTSSSTGNHRMRTGEPNQKKFNTAQFGCGNNDIQGDMLLGYQRSAGPSGIHYNPLSHAPPAWNLRTFAKLPWILGTGLADEVLLKPATLYSSALDELHALEHSIALVAEAGPFVISHPSDLYAKSKIGTGVAGTTAATTSQLTTSAHTRPHSGSVNSRKKRSVAPKVPIHGGVHHAVGSGVRAGQWRSPTDLDKVGGFNNHASSAGFPMHHFENKRVWGTIGKAVNTSPNACARKSTQPSKPFLRASTAATATTATLNGDDAAATATATTTIGADITTASHDAQVVARARAVAENIEKQKHILPMTPSTALLSECSRLPLFVEGYSVDISKLDNTTSFETWRETTKQCACTGPFQPRCAWCCAQCGGAKETTPHQGMIALVGGNGLHLVPGLHDPETLALFVECFTMYTALLSLHMIDETSDDISASCVSMATTPKFNKPIATNTTSSSVTAPTTSGSSCPMSPDHTFGNSIHPNVMHVEESGIHHATAINEECGDGGGYNSGNRKGVGEIVYDQLLDPNLISILAESAVGGGFGVDRPNGAQYSTPKLTLSGSYGRLGIEKARKSAKALNNLLQQTSSKLKRFVKLLPAISVCIPTGYCCVWDTLLPHGFLRYSVQNTDSSPLGAQLSASESVLYAHAPPIPNMPNQHTDETTRLTWKETGLPFVGMAVSFSNVKAAAAYNLLDLDTPNCGPSMSPASHTTTTTAAVTSANFDMRFPHDNNNAGIIQECITPGIIQDCIIPRPPDSPEAGQLVMPHTSLRVSDDDDDDGSTNERAHYNNNDDDDGNGTSSVSVDAAAARAHPVSVSVYPSRTNKGLGVQFPQTNSTAQADSIVVNRGVLFGHRKFHAEHYTNLVGLNGVTFSSGRPKSGLAVGHTMALFGNRHCVNGKTEYVDGIADAPAVDGGPLPFSNTSSRENEHIQLQQHNKPPPSSPSISMRVLGGNPDAPLHNCEDPTRIEKLPYFGLFNSPCSLARIATNLQLGVTCRSLLMNPNSVVTQHLTQQQHPVREKARDTHPVRERREQSKYVRDAMRLIQYIRRYGGIIWQHKKQHKATRVLQALAVSLELVNRTNMPFYGSRFSNVSGTFQMDMTHYKRDEIKWPLTQLVRVLTLAPTQPPNSPNTAGGNCAPTPMGADGGGVTTVIVGTMQTLLDENTFYHNSPVVWRLRTGRAPTQNPYYFAFLNIATDLLSPQSLQMDSYDTMLQFLQQNGIPLQDLLIKDTPNAMLLFRTRQILGRGLLYQYGRYYRRQPAIQHHSLDYGGPDASVCLSTRESVTVSEVGPGQSPIVSENTLSAVYWALTNNSGESNMEAECAYNVCQILLEFWKVLAVTDTKMALDDAHVWIFSYLRLVLGMQRMYHMDCKLLKHVTASLMGMTCRNRSPHVSLKMSVSAQ